MSSVVGYKKMLNIYAWINQVCFPLLSKAISETNSPGKLKFLFTQLVLLTHTQERLGKWQLSSWWRHQMETFSA